LRVADEYPPNILVLFLLEAHVFIKNDSNFIFGDRLRSYIKIYGPPVYDAIKTLEKLAIDFDEVCIMNPLIATSLADNDLDAGTSTTSGSAEAMEYFTPLNSDVTPERCEKLISKSGEKLGDYDFFFEWFREPTVDELNTLIQKIDEALKPLGLKYTITSK
jgi:hypothetical protein